MGNYKIITDEKRLKEFIDWLPELEHYETYYLCLFARSKYCKGIAHIKSDKAQLKRFTSNKERMFQKIMQLECPMGAHTTKEVGSGNRIQVPQEALALYITINPRDMIKATRNGLTKLLDLALQPYNGFHPYQEVMSEIQKAKSRSEFITFDFDIDKSEIKVIDKMLQECVNMDALNIVETRGGYHVIVQPKKVSLEYKSTFYQDICKVLNNFSSDRDNKGDIMLPIPGTYQGGFTPKFLQQMSYTTKTNK